MDLNLIAVIVGIVEGLTEFLPVSSTGHMIIVGHVLGFEGQLADVFDVFVQLGAILSVVFIYKERFARFFTKDGWDINKGLSVWHVAAGIVPVMLVAFFLYHYIKEYRLEQAAVELVRSAKPVTQIAQAAGYDNASKFSACFKARYGATPSQYRAHAKHASKRSSETKTE